jgi:hypothetical protein
MQPGFRGSREGLRRTESGTTTYYPDGISPGEEEDGVNRNELRDSFKKAARSAGRAY